MKKNKMLRIASVMLVLALITTCVISGTFAKYVTTEAKKDTARVAKWGVGITLDGDSVFNTTYGTLVASSNTEKVVAPGTSNTTGNSIVLSGTPEVAFDLTFALEDVTDLKVASGTTFADKTTVTLNNTTGKFEHPDYTTPADYYPVVFTLSGKINGTDIPTKTGTLTQLASDFADYKVTVPVGANLSNAADNTITLTWSWDAEGHDKEDTYLGDQAAAGTDLKVAYTLKVTATQKVA